MLVGCTVLIAVAVLDAPIWVWLPIAVVVTAFTPLALAWLWPGRDDGGA